MTRRVTTLIFAVVLIAPIAAILLFGLSPSTAMDFYHRWPPSLRWWIALANDPRWPNALLTSFAIGAVSSALGTLLAIPAVLVGRITGSRRTSAVLIFARAPVCVPPIVLAVGLYQLLSRAGLFDTGLGLALAHTGFTLATAVFILSARFDAEPLAFYLVARSLGASPWRAALTWLRATQSMTLVGCLAAGLLISMSEVTVTLYVTDTKVITLSRLILSGITRDINPTGFAAMTAWMVMMTAMLVTVTVAAARRSELRPSSAPATRRVAAAERQS